MKVFKNGDGSNNEFEFELAEHLIIVGGNDEEEMSWEEENLELIPENQDQRLLKKPQVQFYFQKSFLFSSLFKKINVFFSLRQKGCHYFEKCHYFGCHYFEWAQYSFEKFSF